MTKCKALTGWAVKGLSIDNVIAVHLFDHSIHVVYVLDISHITHNAMDYFAQRYTLVNLP